MAPADAAVVAIAARQQGMIATSQLAAAGLDGGAVARRCASGWLTRRHRGVYQVGPIAGPLAAEAAALLACGRRAVLSHRTAAGRWALLILAEGEPVEVTIAGRDPGKHRGVRTHRVRSLVAEDVTRLNGMPLTSPARTLLDLAWSVSAVALARLVEEAQLKRLVSPADLRRALERGHGRPGAPRLRAVLGADEEPALTRSEAERRLLALVRAAQLPAPRANALVGRHEVDLLWPQQRLVVEVDGFAFHSSRAAFERDRRRDAELQASGHRVLRLTWRRLVEEPEAVVAQLAALLNAARPA
jgi:very-short-patch-repair endonuclease